MASMTDEFLEEMLDQGRVRPLPGHLYAAKLTKNRPVDLDGYGQIAVSEVRDSGLVVVSGDTQEAEHYKALNCVILAVGEDPPEWKTRWFHKKRDWNTSFAEQRIGEGTVVSIRAIAGVDQVKGSRFLQLRYDEISAIGQPEDEDVPDMLPAPGWVLVKLREAQAPERGGLVLYDGLADVLDHGNMTFGTVLALPRGYSDGDLKAGDSICFPTHTGVGATEFIEFDDGIRCLPLDDVFGCEETVDA